MICGGRTQLPATRCPDCALRRGELRDVLGAAVRREGLPHLLGEPASSKIAARPGEDLGELLLGVDAVPRGVRLSEERVSPGPLQPLVLHNRLALYNVEGEVATKQGKPAAGASHQGLVQRGRDQRDTEHNGAER